MTGSADLYGDSDTAVVRCSRCPNPASSLVAGYWYCLRHLRDLAQGALEQRDRLDNENQGLKNDKTTLGIAARYGAEVGAVVGSIWRIVNQPLDERDGHGPTRNGQFARIESLLRDFFDEELQRDRARAAEDAEDLKIESLLLHIHGNEHSGMFKGCQKCARIMAEDPADDE